MGSSVVAIADKENKDWAARLSKLMARTDKGDAAAVAQLRQFFDKTPDLWEQCGNMAVQAERAWLTLLDNDNPVVNEALRRKLKGMKVELTGAEPSPLERFLVDRAGFKFNMQTPNTCGASRAE